MNLKSEYPDYLKDKTESQKLARRIQAYWHNNGAYGVRVWVERRIKGKDEYFVVRSNIKIGEFKYAI